MRFLDAVAAHASLSNSFGGVFVAVGLALMAMGQDRANATGTGLFAAPQFVTGLITGALAAVWLISCLVIAMANSRKTARFRDQLGAAVVAGEALFAQLDKASVETWATNVRDLIMAGLGSAEVDHFLSSAGYVSFGSDSARNFLRHRLQRLNELIARSNLRVSFSFDSRRDWFASRRHEA